MQTLADRLRSEGKKIGQEKGEEIGERRGKIETEKRMLSDGISIENIMKYTGLQEKEIETLTETVH